MESTQAETRSAKPCDDVPISSVQAGFDLEVRPFLAHQLLGSALSSTSVELAWTRAEPGQEVASRSDPNPALLIIIKGQARLIGHVGRAVCQGDVVTLPPGEEYGFTDVGRDGLYALRVSFREQGSTQDVTTLEGLLASNELRTQMILNNPFFLLWREGRIESDSKRRMMHECLRLFTEVLRASLAARGTACPDETCFPVLGERLVGEAENDELRGAVGELPAAADPVLRATSSWFQHQMLTLDDPGKAVVNLVLETAGYYLGVLTNQDFEDRTDFETGATDDSQLDDAWPRQLGGEQPQPHALRGLHAVLEATWDMLDVMTTRIVSLVAREMS